jgi:fusion and transport protein UGO1
MTTHKDGVNPLRPYYRAPVIGETADPASASGASPFSVGSSTGTARYASKARGVLADIDYKDYLNDPSPSVIQNAKELVDELLWKYTSVLMAQPFEVAKTILQARNQDENVVWATAEPEGLKRQNSSQAGSIYDVTMARQKSGGWLHVHC